MLTGQPAMPHWLHHSHQSLCVRCWAQARRGATEWQRRAADKASADVEERRLAEEKRRVADEEMRRQAAAGEARRLQAQARADEERRRVAEAEALATRRHAGETAGSRTTVRVGEWPHPPAVGVVGVPVQSFPTAEEAADVMRMSKKEIRDELNWCVCYSMYPHHLERALTMPLDVNRCAG